MWRRPAFSARRNRRGGTTPMAPRGTGRTGKAIRPGRRGSCPSSRGRGRICTSNRPPCRPRYGRCPCGCTRVELHAPSGNRDSIERQRVHDADVKLEGNARVAGRRRRIARFAAGVGGVGRRLDDDVVRELPRRGGDLRVGRPCPGRGPGRPDRTRRPARGRVRDGCSWCDLGRHAATLFSTVRGDRPRASASRCRRCTRRTSP